VRIPAWLILGFSIVLIVFGLYRIRIATKKVAPEAADQASVMGGGFYKMNPRTHLFMGILYVALGAVMLATSFGFNPFGHMFGPKTEEPTKDTAPSKPGSVPVDTIAPAGKTK
jgi:hypothetical protein